MKWIYLQIQWIEEENNIFAFVLSKVDLFKLSVDHCGAGKIWGWFVKCWHVECFDCYFKERNEQKNWFLNLKWSSVKGKRTMMMMIHRFTNRCGKNSSASHLFECKIVKKETRNHIVNAVRLNKRIWKFLFDILPQCAKTYGQHETIQMKIVVVHAKTISIRITSALYIVELRTGEKLNIFLWQIELTMRRGLSAPRIISF